MIIISIKGVKQKDDTVTIKCDSLRGKEYIKLNFIFERNNPQFGLEEFSHRERELKKKLEKEIEGARKISEGTREEKREFREKKKRELIGKERKFIVSMCPKFFEYFPIHKVDFNNISPKLVLCKSSEEKRIWKWLRIVVSSLQYNERRGRDTLYFLIDENSGCIMGILGLGSPISNEGNRDDYISWSKRDKYGVKVFKKTDEIRGKGKICVKGEPVPDSIKSELKDKIETVDNKLNNVVEIHTCVQIPPFNDILVGKLMTMLCFSQDVMDNYFEKYGDPLLGVFTTGLNGKSIMYDRIEYLNFLGLSKGKGVSFISKSLWGDIKEYYFNEFKRVNRTEWEDLKDKTQSKARIIGEVKKRLGVDEPLFHGHQRGIYFGYTYKNSRKFLNNLIRYGGPKYPENYDFNKYEKMDLSEKENFWKERWEKKEFGYIKKLELFPKREVEDILEYWKKRWLNKRIPSRLDEIEQKRFDFLEELKKVMFSLNRGQKKLC